ncbi:MAG: hypothetical protein ACYDH1_07840 [Anaerolineaceae bacterium]
MMKKIAVFSAILITSLACNLSQYMSDTPPVNWVEPTPNNKLPQDLEILNSTCFPLDSLSESYQRLDGQENISENPYLMINQILVKLFKEAKLTQTDTYVSEKDQTILSCAIFSPLQPFEKISFDFMLTQPQNLIEIADMPEIELTISDLTNQIQKLGDSFAAYHIETKEGSTKKAELVATRTNDTVTIYTFIYSNSNNNLEDILKVINSAQ